MLMTTLTPLSLNRVRPGWAPAHLPRKCHARLGASPATREEAVSVRMGWKRTSSDACSTPTQMHLQRAEKPSLRSPRVRFTRRLCSPRCISRLTPLQPALVMLQACTSQRRPHVQTARPFRARHPVSPSPRPTARPDYSHLRHLRGRRRSRAARSGKPPPQAPYAVRRTPPSPRSGSHPATRALRRWPR